MLHKDGIPNKLITSKLFVARKSQTPIRSETIGVKFGVGTVKPYKSFPARKTVRVFASSPVRVICVPIPQFFGKSQTVSGIEIKLILLKFLRKRSPSLESDVSSSLGPSGTKLLRGVGKVISVIAGKSPSPILSATFRKIAKHKLC